MVASSVCSFSSKSLKRRMKSHMAFFVEKRSRQEGAWKSTCSFPRSGSRCARSARSEWGYPWALISRQSFDVKRDYFCIQNNVSLEQGAACLERIFAWNDCLLVHGNV